MPVHRCGVSALCLHELRGGESDEAEEFEYVEIDPTGRYGRYKEVLGKGAFKTVYRAFDQEDGIEVAWNQVQDVLLRTQEDLDRLYSEIHLLNQLKHKNIIKLYHSWVDNKAHTVNFITEIFTSGTLRQYRKRHKHIDIKAVKNWSRQILRGLLYLHSHDPPIIHRDLKCDNIFINGNQGEVKIGDLGLAAILQHAHARSVIGTPEFMAPELYEEEYTELVDIYSFGMCLLEMVTSEYPYSECSNAAQIYKKVLMGKKPEALKLVKDPELRQLIEKCLAPASKRLPARELLVDPFLQTEGSKTSVEPSSHVGLIVRKTSGMDDLGIISEDPHGISATVQISYVLKETLPGSDLCGCSSGESQTANSKALSNNDSILSHPREDRARSVDFRVNGKRIEDDNIFLKLRISGSEAPVSYLSLSLDAGQVRDIHFPFDVESDTAMCVASEMVAELDLTDQDVTKIAEMIDAAIMALVPEWKPGVAIDETCYEAEVPNVEDDSDVAGFYGVPVEDVAVHSAMVEMMSPSRVEGLMYERFEEVTYQCHRSEYPAHEIEEHDEYPVNEVEGHAEQCTFSSDTTDMSKEAEWSLSDGSGFHASQEVMTSKEAVSPVFESSLLTDLREKDMDTGNAPASFSELVEFKRKSSCTNFVHKIWEGLVHDHPFTESNTTLTTAILHHDDDDDDDDDDAYDEEAARELAELFDRYEQEKLELQHRHEAAVEEVKRRHRERKIMKFEDSDNSCHSFCNKLLVRPLERLKFEDRLFEMQQNVQCEHGSMNGSITSMEDLSSIGQDTPRSMSKGSVWQEQRI